MITVMVVDDHPIWRNGVARDLDRSNVSGDDPAGDIPSGGISVVATADGVAAAARIARAVQPDVVLMDMRLPDGDGAQATALVLEASPRSRVLVLSASAERADVLDAVKAGASGYLVKSASSEELASAIRSVHEGRAVYTPGLAGLVLGEYRRIAEAPDAPTLTDRETEVLRFVAKGLSARQIAERLSISHRTVENHVQSTLRKLQLGNRVELARYAIERGLDAPE
jgi:DNA-binding NarL/FixJ family response regulator